MSAQFRGRVVHRLGVAEVVYREVEEAPSIAESGSAPDGVGTFTCSPHRVNVTISPFADLPDPLVSTASTGSDFLLAATKRVSLPPPPGASPEMLLTHCRSTFDRLPVTSGPDGVTLARADERATLAETDWNAESVDCTETHRPVSVGTSELGSPK